jgi:hypothetical protein
MMFRSRPLIRLAAQYKAMLDECKADLARMHFEHQCRQADLRRELDAVRSELDALKDVVRRRHAVESELAELYRERSIARAQAAERDPTALLQ